MQIRRMLVLAAVMSLMPALSSAQGALAPGARLRLTTETGSGPVVGELVTADGATLTLQTPGQTKAVVVRRDAVRKVEMSAGRHSRGRGALLGLAIGVGAGAVMGAALGAASSEEGEQAYGATGSALVTGFLLGVCGAAVGLAVTPSEKWQELPLDRVHVRLTPLRGRGGAVSVTWVF